MTSKLPAKKKTASWMLTVKESSYKGGLLWIKQKN